MTIIAHNDLCGSDNIKIFYNHKSPAYAFHWTCRINKIRQAHKKAPYTRLEIYIDNDKIYGIPNRIIHLKYGDKHECIANVS